MVAMMQQLDANAKPVTGVVDVFLGYGICGAMLVVMLWAYWRKDSQLQAEQKARMADTKAWGEAMANTREKQATSMEKFTEAAETLLQEMRDQQRLDRASSLQRPPTGRETRIR